MKRYSFAESISEFQDLAEEDKKEAFRYAYGKRFHHWQTYVWFIIPFILGILMVEIAKSNTVPSLIVGFTVVLAMTFSDYMTKPIFRKHLLDYIQIQKESSNQNFEALVLRSHKNSEQAGAGQPATRPESDFEGSDTLQPESEELSR